MCLTSTLSSIRIVKVFQISWNAHTFASSSVAHCYLSKRFYCSEATSGNGKLLPSREDHYNYMLIKFILLYHINGRLLHTPSNNSALLNNRVHLSITYIIWIFYHQYKSSTSTVFVPHIHRPNGPLDLKCAWPIVDTEYQRRPPAVHVVHFTHQRALYSRDDEVCIAISMGIQISTIRKQCALSRRKTWERRTLLAAGRVAGRCTRQSPAHQSSRTKCSSGATRWQRWISQAPGLWLDAGGRWPSQTRATRTVLRSMIN